MSNSEYGVRVSHQSRPDVKSGHNRREPKIVASETHIDSSRRHEVIMDFESVEKAYEKIFGESIANYNAKQKRKDRQIKNYLQSVLKDERRGKNKKLKSDNSRKPIYESIFQLGRRDNQIEHEKAVLVLKDYVCNYLPLHYPNMKIVGVYMHNDEFSLDEKTGERIDSPPHLHVDWIPVCHCLNAEEQENEKIRRQIAKKKAKDMWIKSGKAWTSKEDKEWQKIDWQEGLVEKYGKSLTTGMELQTSLTGALLEMGYKTGRVKGWTAQMAFEEDVRHSLEDFAEQRGIKIDRTKSPKHREHEEKTEFQLRLDNEKRSESLDEKEKQIYQAMKEIDEQQAQAAQSIFDSQKLKESVEQQQMTLIAKQTELQNLSEALSKKEKNQFQKESDLENREDTIRKNSAMQEERNVQIQEFSKVIERKANDINYKEKQFAEKSNLVDSCDEICSQVRSGFLSIENAEARFHKEKDLKPFSERFKSFVKDCKKVVVGVVIELNKYRRAFKNFWKSTAEDFRHLASKMEREGCSTFEIYHQKELHGMLHEQLEQKKQNHQDYIARQKKINEKYGMER